MPGLFYGSNVKHSHINYLAYYDTVEFLGNFGALWRCINSSNDLGSFAVNGYYENNKQ